LSLELKCEERGEVQRHSLSIGIRLEIGEARGRRKEECDSLLHSRTAAHNSLILNYVMVTVPYPFLVAFGQSRYHVLLSVGST
jgi:hypothetical protein